MELIQEDNKRLKTDLAAVKEKHRNLELEHNAVLQMINEKGSYDFLVMYNFQHLGWLQHCTCSLSLRKFACERKGVSCESCARIISAHTVLFIVIQ